MSAVEILILLAAANTTPWLVARMLGNRFAAPLDLGIVLPDGERIFGNHKTWRGLIAGALVCALATQALGIGSAFGLSFGLLSLTGDLASSAFKRRVHYPPGREAPIIDQLPECLLPLALLAQPLRLEWDAMLWGSFMFIVLDWAGARLRHRPHIAGKDR